MDAQTDTFESKIIEMIKHGEFKKVPDSNFLWSAPVDGLKVGLIHATWNDSYQNYSLNCEESERLRNAIGTKINRAYVVYAKQALSRSLQDIDKMEDPVELWERDLKSKTSKPGKLGQFWTLDSDNPIAF
jgi:hypothetical protein